MKKSVVLHSAEPYPLLYTGPRPVYEVLGHRIARSYDEERAATPALGLFCTIFEHLFLSAVIKSYLIPPVLLKDHPASVF
ncbi:hypothetical protein I312_105222 [Cryptococcus bacillisporus CA1280]|uniref:uncharacterized protein n=1 Tax=Cryptococcus bacillisporus CA1280 TaxID=1296109 RepID=UPI00336965A9